MTRPLRLFFSKTASHRESKKRALATPQRNQDFLSKQTYVRLHEVAECTDIPKYDV